MNLFDLGVAIVICVTAYSLLKGAEITWVSDGTNQHLRIGGNRDGKDSK